MGTFSVPENVENHIDFVSGLSEFPVPRYSYKKTPDDIGIPGPDVKVTIAPQSLYTIYKIPAGTKITNSSAGVIEWDDQYYDPAQLTAFAKQFNLQENVPTSAHTVGTNDPTSPQLEATLDIQYILATGINAEGWFWIENDGVWLYGWAVHFFGTADVPNICSISYGWNEEDQCEDGIGAQECQQLGVNSQQYVARVNTEFQKIGLRGVSLLSASGDSGANGRTDPYCTETHLNPPYPGASPFITAVGATQITDASGIANLPNPPAGCQDRACASGGTETAVSFAQAQFASGGGFSVVASQPSYQTDAVAAYMKSGVKLPPASYYNANGRGFPDVAALGSAVLIYAGVIEKVGGTSCSCPIWAGIIADLNDYVIAKTGKPLGFLNPLIYQMAAAHPAAFTDITVGDNLCTEGGCRSNCQGYYAAKGWDPVTGWGTPVYTEMLAYIKSTFNI
jgi:tripeptidyl-peptidase-1